MCKIEQETNEKKMLVEKYEKKWKKRNLKKEKE